MPTYRAGDRARLKWAEEVRKALSHWLDVRKRALETPASASRRHDYGHAVRRLELAASHFLGRAEELMPPAPPTLEKQLEDSLREAKAKRK